MRADGRQNTDIRVPSVVNGVVFNTVGSSFVEIGGCKIACSVRGPLQLTTEYRGTKGKIVCNVSYAPFAHCKGGRIDPLQGRGNASSEKEMAFILEGICEQVVVLESFPQLCYEINFVVLATEGGDDLPALCASASSALMEAGVEMLDVFAASSAAVVSANGDNANADTGASSESIIVDPTITERNASPAFCTVAATTNSKKTLYYSHEGAVSVDIIAKLFQHALVGCQSQRKFITAAL